jgi:hypothetical protein
MPRNALYVARVLSKSVAVFEPGQPVAREPDATGGVRPFEFFRVGLTPRLQAETEAAQAQAQAGATRELRRGPTPPTARIVGRQQHAGLRAVGLARASRMVMRPAWT